MFKGSLCTINQDPKKKILRKYARNISGICTTYLGSGDRASSGAHSLLRQCSTASPGKPRSHYDDEKAQLLTFLDFPACLTLLRLTCSRLSCSQHNTWHCKSQRLNGEWSALEHDLQYTLNQGRQKVQTRKTKSNQKKINALNLNRMGLGMTTSPRQANYILKCFAFLYIVSKVPR